MGYYMAYYLFPFQKVDHLLYVLVTEYRPTILTKFGSSLRSEKAGTVLHNIFRGGGAEGWSLLLVFISTGIQHERQCPLVIK